MTIQDLPAVTEQRLITVFDRLQTEIEKALRFVEHPDPVSTAEQKATDLCDSFPEIRRIIQTDVEAAYLGDPAARSIEEIILATNPNPEGEATALFVAEQIEPTGVQVSRIGYGMPIGGDLEYVDAVTVRKSLENRTRYSS